VGLSKDFSLFDTVPTDLMGFGWGASLNAKSVQSFLGLSKEDVSRIARNPLMGDLSPRDMIRHGRFERLRKFILTALSDQPSANHGHTNQLDVATARAVEQFRQRIGADFAAKALIVFGSRARGDHRPDSDADVAVLLEGAHQPFLDTKLRMSDVAYDVLLDTGINISPIPIWMDEWEDPQSYINPALLANIAREGVRV
jgi:predicted nucleotidyltransferase